MLNYDKIFLISDPCLNRPFRGVIENSDLDEFEITRGEKTLNEIVLVKHSMGEKKPCDFIWTTIGFPLIVSERVIEIFKSNAITGWKTYDVEIYSKENKLIDQKYYVLIITGRCGFRDYSTSPIIMDTIGITTEPHLSGFYFKDDFWDGSDLFMCNPNEIGQANIFKFCTEKVVRLMKKEKIKNVEWEKTTDLTMSISLYNIELSEKQKIEMEKLKASR
ncbi:hypothetical protein [Gelidibacter japonicus]|uniref:hypothetical protein n=1 Tax=Gelidibacter japonicus TaxID=1962232 RepID=UPI0013D7FFFF|nr:hypothetical protein [Gelidibacter japonicus]MCL8009389.1 hypothetical protein [Gelidibacter japonicus]